MKLPTLLIGFLAAGVVQSTVAQTTVAQDFRVDTEIFIWEEEKPADQPIAETLTIFRSGVVYDFQLNEPREVTIFDSQRGRFSVLDESRRVKASVSTQDILDFVLSLDSHASESKDSLFAFAARPKFDISAENVQENGQPMMKLTLASDPLQYVVLAHKPQAPEAAAAYRQFADWFARLNAARPGNLPPGPRLALNQSLAEHGLLPLEITRTIVVSGTLGRSKQVKVTSRHLANWSLSGEDRKRIERAGDGLAKFENVSFDEYRNAALKAGPPKQARR